MKNILINTNYKDSAGARVCAEDLGKKFKDAGFDVSYNDWEYSRDYDLILFMSRDSGVKNAKNKNPQAIIGLMDPKLTARKIREVKKANFLLVSSIEQREAFLKYNKNIFIYYMFPNIEKVDKTHIQKDKILIGYHGNKLHLNNFHPHINNALDSLSEKYNIELNAMYNIEKLGKWEKTLPKKIKVNHIQWSEENYYKELSKCDIGIVPNLISINKQRGILATKRFLKENILKYNFAYTKNDYLTRYKYSTNPGRIYIFSQLSIPVVSDFTPSSSQLIQDGKSGFIVNGEDGWVNAIEKLILDHKLRQSMSENLHNFIDNNHSIEKNFRKLISYIEKLR